MALFKIAQITSLKIAKTTRFLDNYYSSKMRLRILLSFCLAFFKKPVGV